MISIGLEGKESTYVFDGLASLLGMLKFVGLRVTGPDSYIYIRNKLIPPS